MSAASFSLAEIIQWTGGRFANEAALGRSASDVRVSSLSGLAGSKPEQLAFFFSRSYQNEIPMVGAGILVTGEPFVLPLEKSGLPLWKKTAIVACRDPYLALAIVSAKFAEKLSSVSHLAKRHDTASEIHPKAVVHTTARLGRGVKIGAGCVIEENAEIGDGTVLYPNCFVGPGCRIGEDVVLFPNVVLYEWTQIGNRVRLHAGVVIGADGFGYAPRFEGGQIVSHEKIYHLGRVIIADDVEVGAGSAIDRGTINDTRIDRGAKIDNNVQIGHNCHVGEGAIMCGMSGLAGSADLGKFCYVGALAGLGNQVVVGDGTKLGPGTLAASDVPAGKEIIGFPPRDPKDFYKIHALLNRLLSERQGGRKKAPKKEG